MFVMADGSATRVPVAGESRGWRSRPHLVDDRVAAWQRPDQFSKVLSWVGSFTDIASGPTLIAGGHNYPALIRKTSNKPIRVFLQDGENDLDNEHGNWPLANLSMASSLRYKGYDCHFVFGHGFHSDRHGRAILPDSLRWLWRPDTAPQRNTG